MDFAPYLRRASDIAKVMHLADLFYQDSSDDFAQFPYLYASAEESAAPLTVHTCLFLEASPQVHDDEECLPIWVVEQDLCVLCSGELLMDVYDFLLEKNAVATAQDFVAALNHYIEYDDFLDENAS